MVETVVMTVKMVQGIFNCTERTALSKLKKARLALGKAPNKNGRSGADPITVEQFNFVFGLDKPEKK
jgi:hypothetical protein